MAPRKSWSSGNGIWSCSLTRRIADFGVDPAGTPLPAAMPLDPSSPIAWASAGDNHTVALTSTGVVLTWGANQHGQLGTGDTDHHSLR